MAYRLMCLTAHPDDESGAFAGALLTAHARDAETSVICLTEGQAATFRGTARTAQELADFRRAEFHAACKVLNVTYGEVLEYPDGELRRQSFYDLAGVLVRKIRERRPQVVLTFGGDGGVNLHRDHTMISLLATAAFHWAGKQNAYDEQIAEGLQPYAPQKLYYSSPPFLITRSSEDEGRIAQVPYSLSVDMAEWKDRKLEAFLQHSTQREVLERVREVFDRHADIERYLLVASRAGGKAEEDRDIFQGVIED